MYERSLITFIDILGFRELIKSSTFDVIQEKLKQVRRLSGDSDSDGEGLRPTIIQFSDSIIRIRPIESKANATYHFGILFDELYDLVLMQGELVKHGVCIRGGLAIGDVHTDGQTAFGPGFVRAYELESSFAIYPRIVVDPQVLAELKSNKFLSRQGHSYDEEARYISKFIRRGGDGIFFVDYLHAFLEELDEPEFEPLFLKQHRALILNYSNKIDKLDSVGAKYLWLANYHNRLVRKLSSEWLTVYGLNISDLDISPKDMPFDFEF